MLTQQESTDSNQKNVVKDKMFAELIEEQRKINKKTEIEVIQKLKNSHGEEKIDEQDSDLESIADS